MKYQLLDDGTVLAPMRAEGEGLVGDGIIQLRPGDERYDEAVAAAEHDVALAKEQG